MIDIGSVVSGADIGRRKGRYIRVLCPGPTDTTRSSCHGERWVAYKSVTGYSTERWCPPCNLRNSSKIYNSKLRS